MIVNGPDNQRYNLPDDATDDEILALFDTPSQTSSRLEMLPSHSRPWTTGGNRQSVMGIASPAGRAQAAQVKKTIRDVALSPAIGGAKIADTAAALVGSVAEKPETSLASKVQRNITEPAIKYWEGQKSPEIMPPSTSKQVLSALGELAPTMMLGAAALPTMAATATYQTGKDLLEADIPLEVAQKAAVMQGAGTAAMGAIPGAAPTLGKSALLALANPVTGMAQRAATREYLKPYNEQVAEGFNPTDPAALAMDVAMAIPGMAQHPGMKRMQAIKDADLLSKPAAPVVEQPRVEPQQAEPQAQREAIQEEAVRQHNQQAILDQQQKAQAIAQAQQVEQAAAKYVGSRVEQTFETPQGKEVIRWEKDKQGGIKVTTVSPTANGRSKSVERMSLPDLADYLKSKDVVLREQYQKTMGGDTSGQGDQDANAERRQAGRGQEGLLIPQPEAAPTEGRPVEVTSEQNVQETVPQEPTVRQDVPESRELPVVPEESAVPLPEGDGVSGKPEIDQLKAKLQKLKDMPEPRATDKTIIINGEEVNLQDVNKGKRAQKIKDIEVKIAELEKTNDSQGTRPAEVVGTERDRQEPGGAIPDETGSRGAPETGGAVRNGLPAEDAAIQTVKTESNEQTEAAGTTAEVKRGEIGGKLATGEVQLTATGRKTTPSPKIDTSTNGKAGNTFKRVDSWLMENAMAEAEARGDEYNARMFRAGKDRPTTADKYSAEMYLFGEAKDQPKVIPSILKPLRMDGTTRPEKSKPAERPPLPQKSIDLFNAAIEARDIAKLKEMIHPDNKGWRKMFEEATGEKLPMGVSKSEQAVDRWAKEKTVADSEKAKTAEVKDTPAEVVDDAAETAKKEGALIEKAVKEVEGLDLWEQEPLTNDGKQRLIDAVNEIADKYGIDRKKLQKESLWSPSAAKPKAKATSSSGDYLAALEAPGGTGYADTGGYAERTPLMRETTQTFLELPEMLKIYKAINEGKTPKLVDALAQGVRGRFTGHKDGTADIKLRKDLFAGPEISREKVKAPVSKTTWEKWQETVREANPDADIIFRQGKPVKGKVELIAYKRDPSFVMKVFAHEIGHAVDYLPDSMVRGRGNILGHIAALKRYMEKTLAMYPGAKGEALTEADIARFEAEAVKEATVDEGPITVHVVREVPKYETVGITPEMITDIWNGLGNPSTTTPELYKFIAGLSDAEKKAIVVQAVKGIVDERLQQAAGRRQVGVEKVVETKTQYGKPSKAAIKFYMDELIKKEIEKRRLYERDVIMKELKELTQTWKPFDETENSEYTKYRHSPEELYADAVSVLFNEPQLLKDTAPTFYKSFFYYMGERPAFKEAYTAFSRMSKDPEALAKTRLQDRFDMYDRGDEKYNEIRKANSDKQSIKDTFFEIFSDENHHTKQLFDKSESGEAARNRLEAIAYTPGEVSNYYLDQHKLRKENQAMGITDNEFGAYMDLNHIIANRNDIGNSLMTTAATAKTDLAELKRQMGSGKWAAVEQAAERFGNIRKKLFKTWLDEGIITQDQHDLFSSRSNYVRTEVQHYLDSKYGSGTADSAGWKMMAEGTVDDTVNGYIATVLQDMSIIRMGRVNNAKVAAIDHLAPAGSAPLAKRGPEGRPVDPPKGYANMVVLRNGVPEYHVVSDYVAKTYTYDPVVARQINVVWGAIQLIYKNLYISKNMPWMVRNAFFRDPAATFKNNPEFKVISVPDRIRIYKELFKAIPEVYRDVVKGERSEELRQMYDDNMLNIERVYSEKDTTWENELDRMAFEFAQGKSPSQSKIIETAKAVNQFINHWGSVSDKAPKLAGKRLLEAKGLKGEILANRVRNTVGTPDFQVKSGGHKVFNYLGMFYEVRKASFRTMRQAYQADPFQYIAKTISMNILPRLFAAAAANGMFGDELKEAYSKVRKWDRALYNTIPMPPFFTQMLRDQGLISEKTGGYFKLPADYEGQLFGAIAQHLIEKDTKGILNDLYTAQPLSGHAFWGNMGNIAMYLTAGKAYDSFRQKPVLTREQEEYTRIKGPFNKKGLTGMGKYLYNSTLGAALPKLDNKEFPSTPTAFEKAVGMAPGLSSFIVLSDGASKEALSDVIQKDRDVKAIRGYERGDRINDAIREGKTSTAEQMKLYRELLRDKLVDPSTYPPSMLFRQFKAAQAQQKYGIKPLNRAENRMLQNQQQTHKGDPQ